MRPDIQLLQWESLTSPEHIKAKSEEVLHASKVRGRDGLLPSEYIKWAAGDTQIYESLSGRLRNGKYKPIDYRQKLKSKGPGSPPRQISIPAARDRAPIRILADFIKYSARHASPHTPQAKMSLVVRALSEHKYNYFVRIDVKDFYPSLRHDAIERALETHLRVPAAVTAIMNALKTPTAPDFAPRPLATSKGVPQGLSISNIVAELTMGQADKALSSTPHTSYFRYVDDILILSKRPLHRKLFRMAKEQLAPLGLAAHPLNGASSKSQGGKISNGFDYLGYFVDSTQVSVREGSTRRLESRIARIFSRYNFERMSDPASDRPARALEWYLNLTITGCYLNQEKRGWLHFFSLMRDFRLLRHLDRYVHKKMVQYGVEQSFEPKRFITAFRFAAKRAKDSSGYVPDLDRTPVLEQRELLYLLGILDRDSIERMSDAEIEFRFHRSMDIQMRDTERDLAIVY